MNDDVRSAMTALDDASLESALFDLGGAIAVPPTPDVATAVVVRLRARLVPEPAQETVGVRLRWAFVAALLALLLLAAIAAATGFGLPWLRMLFGEPSASPAVSLVPSPALSRPPFAPSASTPGPTLAVRDLGIPATLDAARASVAFPVFVPDPSAVRGSVPSVYLDESVPEGQIVLVYPAAAGFPASSPGPVGPTGERTALLVTESRGKVDEGFLQKTLGPNTTITPVDLSGTRGFWITGAPHEIVVLDASGAGRSETLHEVGDVLVFVREAPSSESDRALAFSARSRSQGRCADGTEPRAKV